MSPTEALLNFLRKHKLLTGDLSPEVLKSVEQSPIWELSRKGLISESTAIRAFSEHLGIEYIDLENEDANQTINCKAFTGTVRPNLCWKSRLIPIREEEDSCIIAMANPLDRAAVDELSFAIAKPIKIYIAEESKIVSLLARYFPKQYIEDDDNDVESDIEISRLDQSVENLDSTNPNATPVIKLTNKILKDAIRLDVSDIHLEPNDSCLAVRFRIDGILQDIITIPKHLQGNITARLKVLSGMDISEKRRPQDGRLRATTNGKQIDMRVSSIPASSGEKLVLRLLQADYESTTFESLGMPDPVREALEKALHRKGKLVLVSGPTGSGKTTTLYVGLNYLRDGTTNITTIEDPIEYKFEHLNQIQVNQAAGVSFASVLRAVLRQDPDIVMIGEVRDPETLKIVFQAAQTGHLVLSTVHTNDAPSAISRLADLGAEPFLLSTTLAGVLAQRLVRKNCSACSTPIESGSLARHQAVLDCYNIDPKQIHSGRGCAECFYTGYKGRLGVYSYLEITDEVSEAIYSNASQERIIQCAKKDGFLQLDEAAAELLAAGLTSFDEVAPYLNREKTKAAPEITTDAPPPQPVPTAPPPVQEVRIHVDHSNPSQPQSLVAPSKASTQQGIAMPRVLIIDDNKSVRKMLATLLRKEMVHVSEAENGLQGLQLVYSEVPDVILCDLKMPELDGQGFLKKIKAQKATRDIPVIMLTVDDDEANEVDLLERGACEFLSKKTSPLVIVSRIRRVLNSLEV